MADHRSDLELYIKKWAWNYRMHRRYSRIYDYTDLEFDVDLSDVSFTVDKPNFTNTRKTPLSIANVVFSTRYSNNTDDTQVVNIKTKRTTSATARFNIKHGFTADYGTGLRFRLPNEVASTFDGDITVYDEDEEKLEQKMSWSFNTQLTAPPRRTTVAKFEVNEERLSCDFSTYVNLRGMVTVRVTVNETKQPLLFVKEDIKTILDEYLPKADDTSPRENIVYLGKENVSWPFRGTLDFHYGISQNEVIE